MIMLRINKNLIIFSGTILITLFSLSIFLQKLPRLTSHVVYYCQSNLLSLLTPIPQPVFLLPFVLLAIFAFYAFIKVLAIVIQSYKLRQHLIKNSTYSKNVSALLKRLGIHNKTYIINSVKPFAFCLGITNANIYISTRMLELLTQEELEVVLRHEKYHVKNRDSLIMVIASFAITLLPFLPILSDFMKNYRIERELKADGEAIRNDVARLHLVSVLKKLLDTTPSPSITFAPAIFEHDTLEPRIAAVTNNSISKFMKYKVKNLVISLAFLSIIAFAAVGPVHAMHIHSDNSHLIMLHAAEDSCLDWGNNLNIHPHH